MLQGRVAVVTGGAQGIGAAVVRLLVSQGARICAADLDAELLEDLRAEVGGDRVLTVAGDLADPLQPRRVFERAVDHFGDVDILVNNAGYFWDAPVHRMTDDQFTAMLEIHALVPFRLMREALSRWRPVAKKEAESGAPRRRKIVNVSSRAALVGLPGAANYAAGKAALIGLTRSAARENARLGVNVNAVAFGAVDTRFGRPVQEGTVLETGGRSVPLGLGENAQAQAGAQRRYRSQSGRAATPEEAAAAVFHLCSPLSDLINGEVVQVNG
ncbi:putative short chain dehydrogenase/reductase [Actinacidiphila reveromycinica]|uniref:Putative short chain dehydrogenase/reductase n=1 Tax=Actinacidiphila reveromycinica TaxID=659352 RepID=A0A7U3UZY4_9ACTN|nr:putative short chain dehydrogenase/reductase [Streptomyces sp. SN-593]